jgi:hypothetical protein
LGFLCVGEIVKFREPSSQELQKCAVIDRVVVRSHTRRPCTIWAWRRRSRRRHARRPPARTNCGASNVRLFQCSTRRAHRHRRLRAHRNSIGRSRTNVCCLIFFKHYFRKCRPIFVETLLDYYSQQQQHSNYTSQYASSGVYVGTPPGSTGPGQQENYVQWSAPKTNIVRLNLCSC